MLTELHQRIREVRQGPDGLLYLLTDEPNGALLKLEPAPEVARPRPAWRWAICTTTCATSRRAARSGWRSAAQPRAATGSADRR